jgi:hypothetical protein
MSSSFEKFAEANDNIGLFEAGILFKIRQHVLGYELTNDAPTTLNFRARWSTIEQKPGGKRSSSDIFGESTHVPKLELQYVEEAMDNHTAVIDALGEELGLEESEILLVERIATQHETEVWQLG